jgi:large subunit ribosomal protein L23
MALFTTKEEKKEKVVTEKAVVKKKADAKEKKAHKPSKNAGASLTKTPHMILKSPRITEKAAYMTMQHAYVFEVSKDATKRDVATVVEALYQVKPVKVNIVNKKPRAFVSRFRNRRGTKAGMKKAYVFLKKGDKIDLA